MAVVARRCTGKGVAGGRRRRAQGDDMKREKGRAVMRKNMKKGKECEKRKESGKKVKKEGQNKKKRKIKKKR